MKLILYTALTLIFTGFGIIDDEITRQKNFKVNSAFIAMNGYDPVSYFRAGPEKGSKLISHAYKGINYWFITEANRTEFIGNPDKYEPAWGGWCGHAMALKGEKVEINPLCYKIIQGSNVLFYKTVFANALSNWEKELKKTPESELMKKGDFFWNSIMSK